MNKLMGILINQWELVNGIDGDAAGLKDYNYRHFDCDNKALFEYQLSNVPAGEAVRGVQFEVFITPVYNTYNVKVSIYQNSTVTHSLTVPMVRIEWLVAKHLFDQANNAANLIVTSDKKINTPKKVMEALLARFKKLEQSLTEKASPSSTSADNEESVRKEMSTLQNLITSLQEELTASTQTLIPTCEKLIIDAYQYYMYA